MKFKFQMTETAEVKEEDKKMDTLILEDFINNKISDKSFGSSIDTFHFGFEMFSFSGQFKDWFKKTRDIKRYSYKNRYLLSISQVDLDDYKKMTEKQQFEIIKEKILESIQNLNALKKSPKDFSIVDFKEYISQLLEIYAKDHGW